VNQAHGIQQEVEVLCIANKTRSGKTPDPGPTA
jgi:hypothetical protein